MKSFFEKAIVFINELIKLRTKESTDILNVLDNSNETTNENTNETTNSKEYTAIQFKIRSYKKWISTLQDFITKDIQINNIDDIKQLKLSDKLSKHLCDLLENGDIIVSDGINNDIVSDSIVKDSIPIKKIQLKTKSIENKGIDNKVIDTKLKAKEEVKEVKEVIKFEAQPKILNGEIRPTDIRGANIYDLRHIHDIGPVNSVKIADDGITLDGLLSEWSAWILKDPSNAILIPSKMVKPEQYTQHQWNTFNIDKQIDINQSYFEHKLKTETKQLYKIYSKYKISLESIKHFNDMMVKIPRFELTKIEILLKKVASHMNKDMIISICGSYRRGKDKSGDVDCLITHPSLKTKEDLETSSINILSSFVELLQKSDIVVDQLSMGPKKFMGFCKLPDKYKYDEIPSPHVSRRIDIRLVPYESYGSSILYFTGSKTFNTQMRNHALKHGYSLSEFGIKIISSGITIPCSTEEEVFKILKYPYKKPEERDI